MNTQLGRHLQAIDTKRHQLGLTYAEIAHQLGVSKSTISYWFNQRRTIPADKLLALAEIVDGEFMLVRKDPQETRGQRI